MMHVFIFLRSIIPMLIVYMVHICLFGFGVDAYELWPSLDIPMHFIGGVVTAWSGCLAYGEYAKRGLLPKLPLPFFFFCLIGLVSFVGILWECYEFIHDTFFFRGNYFQPSIRDVMGDLILDLLGGMVLFLLYSMRNKKR